MGEVLAVAGRVLCAISSFVLAGLVWKTAQYFASLPEKDKSKPLIAWDLVVLFITWISLVVRLI